MTYLPWWLGALLLSGVVLGHWFMLHRQMAVSGRFTALVNRWRFGRADDSMASVSQEEIIRAMRAMTAAEFGDTALPEPAESPPPEAELVPAQRRQPAWNHALFLGGVLGGGLLSGMLAGGPKVSLSLDSASFAQVFGAYDWLGPIALLFGGMLVGFGTRMASGCTSGHGLCGLSRFQKGSFVATACFFGSGALVSFVLGALA